MSSTVQKIFFAAFPVSQQESLEQLKISNTFVCRNHNNQGTYREFRGRGVSSKSQSTYTTTNSLTAGDIIESNKVMFSALTEVLQTTLTSMGNQLHEHSKCQMEQVNKLTEAVNQMTSSRNANKLVARSNDDPENSALKILIIQTVGKMMK